MVAQLKDFHQQWYRSAGKCPPSLSALSFYTPSEIDLNGRTLRKHTGRTRQRHQRTVLALLGDPHEAQPRHKGMSGKMWGEAEYSFTVDSYPEDNSDSFRARDGYDGSGK
jgi:hypothetical protein